MLLDEPYNGVSPIMIDSINELILESSKNKGIILTDHNYENVLKVANQLYLIKDCSTKKQTRINSIRIFKRRDAIKHQLI